MNKVNASLLYMLGSFIFLVSMIIPQFANAQEDIPKINEHQKGALDLFSNYQSQQQQQQKSHSQIDEEPNLIFNAQLKKQEKQQQEQTDNNAKSINALNSEFSPLQVQKQLQQQKVKQGIQQQAESSDDQELEPFKLFFNSEHKQQKVKQQQQQKINQQQLEQEIQQKLEQAKQKLEQTLAEQKMQEQNIKDNQQEVNQQQINSSSMSEISEPLKEQSQDQVTSDDERIKALELFFNSQGQKEEGQQQINDDNKQKESFPEVIIYENSNFSGAQQRINGSIPNIGLEWNDKISSVVVISGTWQFFDHENYGGDSSKQIGPGYYDDLSIPEFNLTDNTITSFKVISLYPPGDNTSNSELVKEQIQNKEQQEIQQNNMDSEKAILKTLIKQKIQEDPAEEKTQEPTKEEEQDRKQVKGEKQTKDEEDEEDEKQEDSKSSKSEKESQDQVTSNNEEELEALKQYFNSQNQKQGKQ